LNTGVYCSLPVYEREDKLKYIMDVMGLRNLPYWLGNLLVDFFAISLMNVAIFGFYAWFYSAMGIDSSSFVLIPSPIEFLLFLIPHGLAIVTIGYAFSFLFGSALSAVKYFPLLYFFGLFLPSLMVIANIASRGFETETLGYLILAACVICPSTTMWFFFLGKLAGAQVVLTLPSVIIALVAHSVFYFLVTLALESRRLSQSDNHRTVGWSAQEPMAIPVDHNDVQFEANRTLQNPDPIKVTNLSKVYDNGYQAVKEVTFGVAPGQIFGLLGPNGAGKSSTFNILTAANGKSTGSVQLLGQEVNKNMPEVFENVGICPQFNALWDFLTVKEHLTLFGNLKGLSGSELEQVVDYYLDVLQLREHANKRAEQLSGGNKRKLSVANAFIGTAHLLFLDEPSTGVDPLARRFLWNSIQQVLKMRQASVVLTTHSMYEAESLSHKIGILINGRFVCIGPTQYLKDKYSHGYKVTVSLMPGAPDPTGRVMEVFPKGQRVHESSYVQMTYHIPFEGFKFSEAFERLEVLKAGGVIKDFSIYNTTLEQIFIYFSRFQIPVGNGTN